MWSLLLVLFATAPALASPRAPPREWPGEDFPLPLAVGTSEDLAFKQTAERQYLIFNLLTAGKMAYDRGEMGTAAAKWESLLGVPQLPADVESAVRPLAAEARRRAGGNASTSTAASAPISQTAVAPARPRPLSTVRGTVSGGGAEGPGGTVVWLKRADGATPRPRPPNGKVIVQREKRFIPRVLAVPVGTRVAFRNDDAIFHNVFSLSRPNDFDLGLYRNGVSRDRTFQEPGAVNLLCNIHASMAGYVYVVDSPYYAQADASGAFSIRGVPPGEYVLQAWNENSLDPVTQPLPVKGETVNVSVAVTADRPPAAFVPDKAGKPRQPQLGY